MEYKTLHSLSYQDKTRYDEEYQKRVQSVNTVFFPIQIHKERSYITAGWEITSIIEAIGILNSTVMKLFTSLPGVAQSYYVRKCLIDEIQTTNDIEGVHSTRKEIKDALNADDKKLARFKGMAKKYEKLLSESTELPLQTCRDIRDLYDEIVSREIEDKDQPDGLIFREGKVFVVSPTQQKRHEGVYPEESIIKAMEDALRMLEQKELPALVRIAVFHYFFGYIHPFYDGNGRISRFISSYLLKKSQYPLLALDLSHTIKENKKKYYHAFQVCNDPRNKGDITPFVIIFLEFLHAALKRINENLNEGAGRLAKLSGMAAQKMFIGDRRKQKKDDLIFIFIQNALFAGEPFSVEELQKYTQLSRTSQDQLMAELMAQGVPIEKTKAGKFNMYKLNIDRLEEQLENDH